ncbi:MAG: glycosyltransferase [Chloroflexi bacterium]|nr:glycosyltransferase [Chloroflexota bacterium]
MKVGIYNQFLLTMGGGERHMGMAAEVLAQAGHDVEVITHVPASIEKLSEKLNLDLRGVRIRTPPLLPFDQLAEMTAEYDLFINGSFMSVVPSTAPRSILLVLFPFPLDLTPIGRFKRRLARHLHRELLVPRYGAGFFGQQELGGSRYRWTAGKGQVLLETPWPGRRLPLRLVVGSFRPEDWGPVPLAVAVEGKILETVNLQTTPGDYVTIDFNVPGEMTTSGKVTLELRSPTYRPFELGGASGEPDDYREVGVAVARVMARHPRHYLYEALFERFVPELGRRLHGLPDERAMHYLETYDVICPISEFSNEWLERYWGMRGSILYPPVDVTAYAPRFPRRPIILGAGRFFEGSHNKKHDAMIRAFGQLVKEGLSGWELHLVGGSMPEARHQRYLEKCRRLARGLPVHFHVDAPFAVLKDLYETASIYWHATGYGENEAGNPIVFEHFGITPVEAMSGGCVPVLLGKGALPELIEVGVSGLLWRTMDEWKRQTLEVATDAALAERLRRGAIERSARFGETVFRDHLLEIVGRLGVPADVSASTSVLG